jgi:hypothetical protein
MCVRGQGLFDEVLTHRCIHRAQDHAKVEIEEIDACHRDDEVATDDGALVEHTINGFGKLQTSRRHAKTR